MKQVDNSVSSNVWENIPFIPRCIKMSLVVFFTFLVSLVAFDCKIILLLSLLLMLFIFYMIFMRKQRIKSTYQWKSYKAKVLSSNMRRGSIFGVTPHYPYVMDIKYEYTMGGKRYISNHYAIESCMEPSMNFIFNEGEAKQELSKHGRGQEVEIYINPSNPDDSVIKQGMSSTNSPNTMFALIIGMILGIFLYVKCIVG